MQQNAKTNLGYESPGGSDLLTITIPDSNWYLTEKLKLAKEKEKFFSFKLLFNLPLK